MLKQVMLGSGSVMLSAAIFASFVNTGQAPVPSSVGAPPVAALPPPPTTTASALPTPPSVVTPQTTPPSADARQVPFGAPMISPTPMTEAVAEPPPAMGNPDSAIAQGGGQYQAKALPHHDLMPQ